MAVAAAVALVATQLKSSAGLAGISEDATGVIDPANGHIVAQYMVGHAPDALAADGGSVWIANGGYRRSSRCLHVTHSVARGNACSRPLPIGLPQFSQMPYVLLSRRCNARST